MCIIDLTHVGESLVAELLKNNPDIVRKILGIEREIKKDDYQVLSEISLAPVQIGGQLCPFDGMSRIDVGIIYTNQVGERICHPIELKLGTSSLGNCRSGIGEFTRGYGLTKHKPPRIGGSMISILDNKPRDKDMTFQRNDICVADESVNQNEEKIAVSDKWTLIVRTEKIAKSLNAEGIFRTQIEDRQVLSFKGLFKEKTVNDTMHALLPTDGDFYKYWKLQQPQQ